MVRSKAKDRYAICIDLGATNIRVAIGDTKGNFITKIEERTKRSGNKNIISSQIIKIINSLEKPEKIEGIGIGSIGRLDFKKGAKVYPPNLPLKSFDLGSISKKLKIPVYILNDGNAAVLGEKIFGAGEGVENLIYITISTGIGSGAIVNNHLLLGKGGNGMEAGHMVIDPEGRLKCDCGKFGHWEAYCSGQDIPKFFKVWLKDYYPPTTLRSHHPPKKETFKWQEKVTSETIFRAAKKGNKTALEFVEELGRMNAIGFANIINIFNPSLITVGGSVIFKNPKLILNPIKKYLKNYIYNPIPEIKITPLGTDIVLYGAIAAVFNKIGFQIKI